jgi:sugar-specific transcriptional regulator TrmB
VRYSPVPPAELIGQLGSRFNHILEAATESLQAIAAPAERDYVWNIQGYDAVIEHAQSLVCAANHELLIAVWQPESLALSEYVASAADRGVVVSTLCLQECPQDCADCRGSIYRYRIVTNRRSRWMMVVRDGAEVLLGDIRPEDVSAVRSKQAHLIEMASWYIRHSIGLAALLGDLDGNLQHLLKPETRALLHALGPGEAGWLDYMLELSRR